VLQQTIVITGASDGIGAASARTLTASGHRVLIVGRSREKTAAVARETGAEPFVADFAHLDDVRALAGRLKGNERGYSPAKAYGDAKLANILFTRGLHARHQHQGISTMAFHPGNVATNFAADTTNLMRFLYHTPLRRLALISAEKGGANLTWAITGRPGVDWTSGTYYDQRTVAKRVNPRMYDDALVDQLWERSAHLVGVAS